MTKKGPEMKEARLCLEIVILETRWPTLLKRSWDLVTGVINTVTILIRTYNIYQGTYNLAY